MDEEDFQPRSDDPKVREALPVLEKFFNEHPRELFYDRQLAVLFEKQYFHWITSHALKELAETNRLATHLEAMPDVRDEGGKALMLRLYRHPAHRYWQTQRKEILTLVGRFSGEFGHALGDYGELLCDAGLGGEGFVKAAKNVREWQGKHWKETAHNLDRVYVRDGIAYGCEIKNTLKYLPVKERDVKLSMCQHLGLKPLFIVRWLPKSHMYEIIKAGGFAILFERQLYPVGQERLAKEVEERLVLPVACVREFPADAVARFVKLHVRLVNDGARIR